jgi:FkbM family methyltransferase
MLKTLKRYIKNFLSRDLKYSFYRIPFRLKKLGSSEYGGWIIPTDQLNGNSVCYLAGAGEDISFDLALANRFHCHVFIFDPTPRAKKHFILVREATMNGERVSINTKGEFYEGTKETMDYLHFEEIGLWIKSETLKFFAPQDSTHVSHSISNIQQTDKFFLAPVDRLSNIMMHHHHRSLDVLKLDIEGAEFGVIDSLIEDKLLIKILCIEFHPGPNGDLSRIQTALEKLEQNGYRVVARDRLDFTFINKHIY